MRLSDLKPGQTAIILKVLGHGAFRKRVMEMGFVRGKSVSVLLDAPLKDPIKYKIMDYEISLRRSEASMIEVITNEEAKSLVCGAESTCVVADKEVEQVIDHSKRTINIALVGNPNCGKTSLFNAASGSHEHVGNYSGVTVDAKKGSFNYRDYHFVIYDLPGTYALSAYSPEELYVRQHLVEQAPDVVVNVVAASNLERNLYLTTELIDMDCTTVVALNMFDELAQSGAVFDYGALGRMLGVPIVPTVSRSGKGIDKLFDTIIDVYENRDATVRHIHIAHNPVIETAIDAVKKGIKLDGNVRRHFAPRYLAIKLLEDDKNIKELLAGEAHYPEWIAVRDQQVQNIERTLGEDVETAIANDKYGFISGALKETFKPGDKDEQQTTRIIDSFVTHKLFGFPIFLLLMWLMFEATFTLGSYPMDWIEAGVAALGNLIQTYMPDGVLKDLITDGIIGGVGGVIVFLPNILILYLFISFMEDSGYMARAAFIMDKIMHRIGLHGKSFIPLIMGFGCNVPAIMATRTIESRSSRLITILINPFMSCSARLPIYILLVGTFFPKHSSIVFLSLYVLGILIAILTARLLRRFLFKKDETPFVMELPPYRMPTARSTMIHMWEKAAQYLRKMGGIILVASIIVWFLSYYPRPEATQTTQPAASEQIATATTQNLTESTHIESSGTANTNTVEETQEGITDETTLQFEQQRNSYIGRIGQFCAPVVEPLGFNWKMSVSLLTGMAAKELIVSTLGVLYTGDDSEDTTTLSQKLQAINPHTGKPDFTPLTALTFMVFVLIYFPCIAAMTAIAHESGSWKWALFSLVYNTVVAWIVAFSIYRIGLLFI